MGCPPRNHEVQSAAMNRQILDLLNRPAAPKILVAGDLILDRYVWGSVTRVSPEAPVQVLKAEREEGRAGGGANVARNLVALGGKTGVAGVVGRDSGGRELTALLRDDGIRTSAIVSVAKRPTSVKTRMIAQNQQMLRVDHETTDPISKETESRLILACEKAAASYDVAVISDYDKGTLTDRVCRGLISAFTRKRKPVLVGLKGRDFRKYRGVTGATLNRAELRLLTGETDVPSGGKKLVRDLRLKFLLVTLGDRGMTLMRSDGWSFSLPATARQVYDVTGAGDTVLATFALAYAENLPLEECAVLANAAAAIVVGKVGTETVTRSELIGGPKFHSEKIVEPGEIRKVFDRERAAGRKIVFTNGVYDLFHTGHLSLLEFARSRGDLLVVGINSDRSVKKLKGEGRPILPEQERAGLLTALAAVDYVVIFEEGTPLKVIRQIRPDVLVKGEDYRGKKVVGREIVEKGGGRVDLAPFVKGVSTTEIVNRILGLGEES